MKTIRVGEVIAGEEEDLDGCIYVVRDGETVFYVGKTRDTIGNRVRRHMDGLGRLGTLIIENLPGSGRWQIECMTLEDCEPFVRQQFPVLKSWGADYAEVAVIRALNPCLNVAYNEDPSGLPARYDRRGEEVKREAVKRLHVPYRGRR